MIDTAAFTAAYALSSSSPPPPLEGDRERDTQDSEIASESASRWLGVYTTGAAYTNNRVHTNKYVPVYTTIDQRRRRRVQWTWFWVPTRAGVAKRRRRGGPRGRPDPVILLGRGNSMGKSETSFPPRLLPNPLDDNGPWKSAAAAHPHLKRDNNNMPVSLSLSSTCTCIVTS